MYTALLQPGDTILGMNLAHGGHLTHGSPVNLSGKLYNVVPYGIDDKGQIDYDDLAKQAQTHKPKMIIGGFSASPAWLTGPKCAKSPTASALTCSSTWRTWRA